MQRAFKATPTAIPSSNRGIQFKMLAASAILGAMPPASSARDRSHVDRPDDRL